MIVIKEFCFIRVFLFFFFWWKIKGLAKKIFFLRKVISSDIKKFLKKKKEDYIMREIFFANFGMKRFTFFFLKKSLNFDKIRPSFNLIR